MTRYEIVAKSGEKREDNTIYGVRIFVRANNKYYLFYSDDGYNVEKPMILSHNANIPLGNWYYVEDFEAEDFVKYPEFVDAIEEYFMYN